MAKETYIVTTKTGLSFTYRERWSAEEKQKSLQTMAGELRVPYFIRLTKRVEDGDKLSTETLSEWETE